MFSIKWIVYEGIMLSKIHGHRIKSTVETIEIIDKKTKYKEKNIQNVYTYRNEIHINTNNSIARMKWKNEIFLILRVIFIQYGAWKRRNNHHYIANSSHRFSVDMRIAMWVQDKIERKARNKCTFLSQRVVYLSNKTIFPIQVNFLFSFSFLISLFLLFYEI